MDGIEKAVFPGPLQHRFHFCGIGQPAAADLSDQPYAGVVHFFEILFRQAMDQYQRAAVDLHGAAGTEMVENAF